MVEERKWSPGQCGNEHKIHTTANWFQFFGWFKGQVWLAYQQVGHMLLSPSNHWPPLFIPRNPNMGSFNFKTNCHLNVVLIVKPTSSQQNGYLQKKKKWLYWYRCFTLLVDHSWHSANIAIYTNRNLQVVAPSSGWIEKSWIWIWSTWLLRAEYLSLKFCLFNCFFLFIIIPLLGTAH